MLSQADKLIIQTVFGKTAEELSGALSSEQEVPLGLKLSGKVYKPEEIESLKTTNQDIGIEIGYKKVSKAAGIQLEAGDKDPVVIADKLKNGIKSTLEEQYKNMTPTEELTNALTAKVAAEEKYNKLLKTHDEIKNDLETSKETFGKLQISIKEKERDNEILSYLPEKMNQDRADALLIIKNTLASEDVDGVTHHKVNGELVSDAVGNPAPLKDAVSLLVENKGWVKDAGAGGGDRKKAAGTMPTNLSDEAAMEYIQKQGKEPMSTEGSQMMVELTRDYTE